MTYLKLKNNRIRISLTKYETEQIFGNSEKIDKDDPKTSLALKMLFKKAAEDNDIGYSAENVWIEVARNLSGGYDIYFTKNIYSSVLPRSAALTFEFSSCDAAIKASRAVISSKHNVEFSRFYRFFDRYRMITLSKNGIYDLPAIFEFAERMLTTRADAAKTIEHGRLIINEKAIEVLSRF